MLSLMQIYDGNQSSKKYTPGHLFSQNSSISLCGFKFKRKAAPVVENEYDSYNRLPFVPELKKLCIKCHKIAQG